jgi:diguanylate cyclase (GGDEF)-like protein
LLRGDEGCMMTLGMESGSYVGDRAAEDRHYQVGVTPPSVGADRALAKRASLVLSGSRAHELVGSLRSWAIERFGATSVALWRCDPGEPISSAGSAGDFNDWPMNALVDCLAAPGEMHTVVLPVGTLCCVGLGAEGETNLAVSLLLPPGATVTSDSDLPDLLLLFRQRLPAALELERLHEAVVRLEEAERLQRALFRIADLAGSDHEMGELLAAIHAVVGELMYAENFFIALYSTDHDALYFPYFRDVADIDTPPPDQLFPMTEYEGSLTAHVLRTGTTLMGPSQLLVDTIGSEPIGFGPQSVDWLGVPMPRGAEVMGAVVVQSYDEQHRYSEKDKTLLNFVAQHIATALERKLAHEQLERRVAERTEELSREVEERQRGERLQAALFRIAELGSTTETPEAFSAAVHSVVGRLLYAGNFYIALLSPDSRQIEFPYSVDEFDVSREPRLLGRGLTEFVLRSGQPLLADRPTIERLTQEGEVLSHGTLSTTWLGVPLICDEQTVGVLAVQSYDSAHRYSRLDQELLTFVSYHIANALMRKRAADSLKFANARLERRVADRTEELFNANRDLREQIAQRERIERQLKHDALHDGLTGLPNRLHLLNRLGEALARFARFPQRRFAVLFLDLDRFKVINDSVGHLVGDELLKEVGGRITRVLNGWGLVARLGGDEFAVLLEPIESESDVTGLAAGIIESLSDPVRVAGKELYTSTSIGIALSHAQYRTPEELLRDADVALYRAKAQGRRRFEVFDEALRREALAQLEMEGNLRRAVVRSEFEPHYQGIVDITSGEVLGYEALLRWRQPNGVLLLPGEFLELAEESGLAESIDWQIYELVFAQANLLLDAPSFVSVNVGARHFHSPQFIERLLALLERYEMPATQLRIEVTERTLLEDPPQVMQTLHALRDHGIRVALDDFGTGYSSLSYLHRFPLHALKIDRSFVSDLGPDSPPSTLAVLRAITSLARSLDLEVIAEGIETQTQREVLMSLGCRLGQGFLFSRPLPHSEIRLPY